MIYLIIIVIQSNRHYYPPLKRWKKQETEFNIHAVRYGKISQCLSVRLCGSYFKYEAIWTNQLALHMCEKRLLAALYMVAHII